MKDTEEILIDDIPEWNELGEGIKEMCLKLAKEEGDYNFLKIYDKQHIQIDEIPNWSELDIQTKIRLLEIAKKRGDENFLKTYGQSLEK